MNVFMCDSYILAVAGGALQVATLRSIIRKLVELPSQKQLLYVGTQTSVLMMGLFMECSVILILSRAVNHGNSPLLVKNARVTPGPAQ